jgi:hypothetical protein
LRSKEDAKIEYDKKGPGSYAKQLILVVEDGSGIEALSIIGTGRNGGNGGRGSNGRDAKYYINDWGVPKCKSATSGSAGGNGTDATDGESGMSIRVTIANLNPEASINIVSNAGKGGQGGDGGDGGNGGDGNTFCNSGKYGGRGGNSGRSGNGGNGGTITTMLTYSDDATQEQINEGLTRLTVTNEPSKGGPPGTPGTGGRGGDGKGLGSSGFVHKDGSDQGGGSGNGWGSDGVPGTHEKKPVPPRAASDPTPKDEDW